MLILLIDGAILAAILLASFLTIRGMFRKHKQGQIDDALFRQKVAEDLAKRVEAIDAEAIKLNEKKVNDKLNGLQ